MLTDDELRRAFVEGKLASAVVDSGATTTCVKPMAEQQLISSCGTYELKGAPFVHTGKKSNKIFRMALGHLADGRDEVKMNVDLRDAAREGHTVLGGLRNNLYSVSAITQAGYGAVFDQDYFAVVDADEVRQMI